MAEAQLRRGVRGDDEAIRGLLAANFPGNPKRLAAFTRWQYWDNPFGEVRSWLFEAEGMTFSEYVLRQRLTSAYRLLRDPRRASDKISTIALDAGFGDDPRYADLLFRTYTNLDEVRRVKGIEHIGFFYIVAGITNIMVRPILGRWAELIDWGGLDTLDLLCDRQAVRMSELADRLPDAGLRPRGAHRSSPCPGSGLAASGLAWPRPCSPASSWRAAPSPSSTTRRAPWWWAQRCRGQPTGAPHRHA